MKGRVNFGLKVQGDKSVYYICRALQQTVDRNRWEITSRQKTEQARWKWCMVFKTSEPIPSDILPLAWPNFWNLSKQWQELETNSSDARAYRDILFQHIIRVLDDGGKYTYFPSESWSLAEDCQDEKEQSVPKFPGWIHHTSKSPKALIWTSQYHSEAGWLNHVCYKSQSNKTLPQIETFLRKSVILLSKRDQEKSALASPKAFLSLQY